MSKYVARAARPVDVPCGRPQPGSCLHSPGTTRLMSLYSLITAAQPSPVTAFIASSADMFTRPLPLVHLSHANASALTSFDTQLQPTCFAPAWTSTPFDPGSVMSPSTPPT